MGHKQTAKKLRFRFVAALLLTTFSLAFTFSGVSFAAGASKELGRDLNGVQATATVYAYNAANDHLISFDAAAPGTILTDVAITGLQSGEFLSGIDFRPANGKLYAVGSSDLIYTINLATGAATAVSTTPFTPDIDANNQFAGFDFNPTSDRIRVVTTGSFDANGAPVSPALNFRVNPDTGVNVGNDSTPTFATGDPNAGKAAILSQLAYTNSNAGATMTTAYAIDFNTDSLTTLGSVNGTPVSPNSGQVFTVGSLGIVTANEYGGFDIQGGTNAAYAALRVTVSGANRSNFYTVNLSTGTATLVGRIGTADNPVLCDGIAVLPAAATPAPARTLYDFDGDKKADASVFRPNSDPTNNYWYILNSATGVYSRTEFGIQTDKLAPADYDGDNKTDIAVYREGAQSELYIFQSATGTVRSERFGITGDRLTVGDWDGDGKADPSVYREGASGAQSYFFYRGSLNNPTNGTTYIPWGTGGDKAMRGDFDGDGKFDPAVFRPSNNTWYIRNSSNGAVQYIPFGLSTDKFVPADYDGDGKTDVAVFRGGTWYILQSSSNQVRYVNFGVNSDTLVPADYDADGKTDVAVWRNGVYYILQSTNTQVAYIYFGAAGDIPVASAYIQ